MPGTNERYIYCLSVGGFGIHNLLHITTKKVCAVVTLSYSWVLGYVPVCTTRMGDGTSAHVCVVCLFFTPSIATMFFFLIMAVHTLDVSRETNISRRRTEGWRAPSESRDPSTPTGRWKRRRTSGKRSSRPCRARNAARKESPCSRLLIVTTTIIIIPEETPHCCRQDGTSNNCYTSSPPLRRTRASWRTASCFARGQPQSGFEPPSRCSWKSPGGDKAAATMTTARSSSLRKAAGKEGEQEEELEGCRSPHRQEKEDRVLSR